MRIVTAIVVVMAMLTGGGCGGAGSGAPGDGADLGIVDGAAPALDGAVGDPDGSGGGGAGGHGGGTGGHGGTGGGTVWKTAQLTTYTSFPACCPDSPVYDPRAPTDECDDYSGCAYMGEFAAIGKKSFDCNADCDDCCAQNSKHGFLVDMELWTTERELGGPGKATGTIRFSIDE